MHITNSDPNIRWGKKTLRLTFTLWDATLTVEETVGGNVRGMENLECALENLLERIEGKMVLVEPNGDTLHVGDIEDVDDLMAMLVSAQVIHIVPERPEDYAPSPRRQGGSDV